MLSQKLVDLKKSVVQCASIIKLKEYVFAVGGRYGSSYGSTEVYKFNENKCEFDPKPKPYPISVDHPGLIAISDSELISTGGDIGGKCITDGYKYSIVKDEWTQFPSMNHACHGHCGLLFENKIIFVFGGEDLGRGETPNVIERIEVTGDKWTYVTFSSNCEFYSLGTPFQISSDEIIFLRGVYDSPSSLTTYVFNVKSSSVKNV